MDSLSRLRQVAVLYAIENEVIPSGHAKVQKREVGKTGNISRKGVQERSIRRA